MLEFQIGMEIREVGLARNSEYLRLGASVDGLCDPFCGVEIKCPGPRKRW